MSEASEKLDLVADKLTNVIHLRVLEAGEHMSSVLTRYDIKCALTNAYYDGVTAGSRDAFDSMKGKSDEK